MRKVCNTCSNNKLLKSKFNFGLIGSIALAILPKCPFCVLAFTSTLVLCNQSNVLEVNSTHISTQSVIISTVFSLIIITAFILNLRTVRSRYALAIACIGILMIMYSLLRSGGYELYYFGLSFVFLSVILNLTHVRIFAKLKNSLSFLANTVIGYPYSSFS